MAIEDVAPAARQARRRRWGALAAACVVVLVVAGWQLVARMPRLERAELSVADPEAVATDTGTLVVTDPSDGTYDGVWTFRNTGPVPVDVTVPEQQPLLYVDVHLVAVDPVTGELGSSLVTARLAPGQRVGVAFSFGSGCGSYGAGVSFGPAPARVTVSALGVRRTVPVDGIASVMIMTTGDIPPDQACLARHGQVGPG